MSFSNSMSVLSLFASRNIMASLPTGYLGNGLSDETALTMVLATSCGGVPISDIINSPFITFSVISLYGESCFVVFFIVANKFVLMTPGSMIIVLIPNGINSYRIDSLKPSNANLALMYPGVTGKPILPATELTFTIVPDFWPRIVGNTAWIVRITPKKFVSN